MNARVLRFLRRNEFQFIWEKLFKVSKIGMNFYGGASLFTSGELHAMQYANEKLKKFDPITVFDVGASSGEFARLVVTIFSSQKNIYSFEPSIHTFEVLERRLKKWGLVEKVKCFHFGFGSENDLLTLYASKAGASSASVYKTSNETTIGYTEKIKIRTIDDFCLENNINQIDFLKIDIEGHEFQAMMGAKRMIESKKIKYILFEFGEFNIISKTFFKDFYNLLSPNYTLYRIVPNGLRRISSYSANLEVFNTINYLAELKN